MRCVQGWARSIGAVLAGLLVAVGQPSRGGQVAVKEAFARAAQLDGRSYVLARSLIERAGKPALPFLKEQARSAEWRERDLAGALILRIEQPAKARLLDYALLWWKTELAFRDDGTVAATLKGPVEALAKSRGEEPPEGREVVFTREAVPLLLDVLGWHEYGTSDAERLRPRVFRILKHLGDPQCAPGLLHVYGRVWGRQDGIVEALASLGKAALPVLRETIRQAPVEWSAKATGDARIRGLRAMRPSVAAALALARIGDAEGARLLVGKLAQASHWEQVSAFSEALGRMGTREGVPVVFAKLAEAGQRFHERQRRLQSEQYWTLREAMRSFGEAASEFLLGQAREERALGPHAIAGGLLFELQRPKEGAAFYRAFGQALLGDREQARYWVGRKDKPDAAAVGRRGFWYPHGPRSGAGVVAVPAVLLLERAYVFSEPEDLVRLPRLKEHPLAFDVLADGVVWSRSAEAARALAAMGDERAVEVYGRLLRSDPPRLVGAQVEAMLLLGSAKAIPLLEEVVRRAAQPQRRWRSWWEQPQQQAAARLAQAAISTLKGDRDALPQLLGNPTLSVRVVAARCLARRGDVRALPVLIEAAAQARAREDVSLREAIVGLGKPALASLAARKEAAKDWREKLLCEAAALRISRPRLAATYDKAAAYRYPGYGMHVLTAGIFRGAGRQLAAAVGEAAVPLLEAAVAFEESPPPRPTAVFALARLKQERSIPVLVAAFPKTHRFRDGHPVAMALEEFGPKGIEAAKTIPPPDPAKARYVSRARRHRGATETLAIAGDVKTVENVIAGLAAPKPAERSEYYGWAGRTRVYLQLARKFHDPRLVDPIVKLLEQDVGEDVRNVALETVSAYKDERIVSLALKALVAGRNGYGQSPPLLALVRQRGAQTVPFLIKLLRESKDERERVSAAWALGQLGRSRFPYWHVVAEDKAEREKVGTAAVEQAFGPLADALADKGEPVQAAAASALEMLVQRRPAPMQAKAVEVLAGWVRGVDSVPPRVVQFLGRSRNGKAAEALLALYRRKPSSPWVPRALGQLRCVEAVPDLVRAVEQQLARGKRAHVTAELDALGELGPPGLAKVHAVLKRPVDAEVRAQAARVLGSHDYGEAFGDVAALFGEVLATPLPARNSSNRRRVLGQLGQAADALGLLDPRRAHPILSRALLRAAEADRRKAIAWRLERLERAHPELRKLSPVGE